MSKIGWKVKTIRKTLKKSGKKAKVVGKKSWLIWFRNLTMIGFPGGIIYPVSEIHSEIGLKTTVKTISKQTVKGLCDFLHTGSPNQEKQKEKEVIIWDYYYYYYIIEDAFF